MENKLSLDKGGYAFSQASWSLWVLLISDDSRFTGVPQRRHRVLMVVSRKPREVLFADNDQELSEQSLGNGSYGFY